MHEEANSKTRQQRIIYALKTKGEGKIPDYIQLRDENFVLIAYFRLERPERALRNASLLEYKERLIQILNDLPYGKLTRIVL